MDDPKTKKNVSSTFVMSSNLKRTALRLFLESGAQPAGTGPPGWAQNLGRASKLFLALYIGVPTRLDYHLVLGPLLGEWPTLGCYPRQLQRL